MSGTLGAESTPYPFDVIVDGHGYRLLDSLESHPFGTHRASYGLSPTFVPRTNIQGDYGDSFQDFWMTFTQRDWSLGEGQRHFKSQDDESVRRFWQGSKIDVRVPGQVTIRKELRSLAAAAADFVSLCPPRKAVNQDFLYVTSANLYTVTPEGAVTDQSAHGVTPVGGFCMATDGQDVYIGHSTGVRKWDGSSFSAFSATSARALAYLNNSLYGLSGTSDLLVYDTSGVATTVFQWKQADGTWLDITLSAFGEGPLVPFGGDLLILENQPGGAVWIYDGTGVAQLFKLPADFAPCSMCVSQGVVFVGGGFLRGTTSGSNYNWRPAIFYWVNGQTGVAWRADDFSSGSASSPAAVLGPPVAEFEGGLLFLDTSIATPALCFYDIATGSISRIASVTGVSGASLLVASTTAALIAGKSGTAARIYPDGTNLATVATITTSLFDGDNSLTKRFKSIIVDGELNSGTIDIAYQADSLDGSFTTLQTGATMGTEYALPTVVTGRSIAVKVTLNRASATAGPTLRRIKVRAAPMLDSFERREYILDLSGRDGQSHILLRDDTQHSKDGHEMAVDLMTAAASTVPITIYDRFGTFTGIVDTDGFTLVEIRPEEYVAMVRIREV